MLTYENITRVKLAGRYVGDIKQDHGGRFFYQPKGSKTKGDAYDSIQQVKESLAS